MAHIRLAEITNLWQPVSATSRQYLSHTRSVANFWLISLVVHVSERLGVFDLSTHLNLADTIPKIVLVNL
jgi:hypothetical protein